jgi:hypothetical protein
MQTQTSVINELLTDRERKFFTLFSHGGMPLKTVISFYAGIALSSALGATAAIAHDIVWLAVLDHIAVLAFLGLFLFSLRETTAVASGIMAKYEAFIDELARRQRVSE